MIKIFFITCIIHGKDRLFLANLQDFLMKKRKNKEKYTVYVLYNMLSWAISLQVFGV